MKRRDFLQKGVGVLALGLTFIQRKNGVREDTYEIRARTRDGERETVGSLTMPTYEDLESLRRDFTDDEILKFTNRAFTIEAQMLARRHLLG